MTIRRKGVALVAILVGLLVVGLLALIAFPMSWARPLAERELAARFGAPATISTLRRETTFSLAPIIDAGGVDVAQPAWAGTGSLATIATLRLRLHLLPLLIGRFEVELIGAHGIRLNLIRDANGRENWRATHSGAADSGDSGLAGATIGDARIIYRDARQRRDFALVAQLAPATGLILHGEGSVDGAPVRLSARGGPMTAAPWPFVAAIEGAALAIHIRGTMARALATQDMDFHVTARADDLKRIDRIIEAGLFGTQPVDISATVRRRPDSWDIMALSGTMGQSAVDGAITARKADGRTKLDGRVHFARLNFDDLASDAGMAKAETLERAQGLKLVPNTRVNIRKIDHTDGRIAITADHIVGGRRPSAITSLRGILNLDHRVLTVDRLRIGLRRGAIVGRAVVDQRAGQPKPIVTIALDMVGSSLAALAGDDTKDDVTARVDAQVRLAGVGDTIREAVGTSNGTIGLAARGGTMSERLAGLVGFDLGKGLLGSRRKDEALRCAVLRLEMAGGRGSAAPLVIDTAISQSTGEGAVTFPDETLQLDLRGAPKGDALLRLRGPVRIGGTIRDPAVIVPPSLKSAGTVLKAIGRALTGDTLPPATDADCSGLVARAIGAGR